MKYSDEKLSLCALGRIFGFEPTTALALISYCGSAEKVFRLSKDELEGITGPYFRYKDQICTNKLDQAYKELADLERRGIYYIGYTEDCYPSILKECSDAPTGLYIRSETAPEELWLTERNIAIVGTRDISSYGRDWCERTVRGIASSESRSLIVSGLALGTDICAHRTALDCGLPTIGVMATGPESIYPHRNEGTARQMISTPGCALITDYPPGTSPLAIHFLRRNRIIAGLSQATILIESKIKGGGMMTSRLAFSYNRDVYALPGRADDLRSQGCNRLIREKIADPLTSVEELMDSLGMKISRKRNRISDREILEKLYRESTSTEDIETMHSILCTIRKEREITIEDIAYLTGLPYHCVSKFCRLLESDGLLSTDLLQRCSIRDKN